MVETSCRAPSVGRAEAPELERPKKHDAGPGGPASAMDSRSTCYWLPCVRLRLPHPTGWWWWCRWCKRVRRMTS